MTEDDSFDTMISYCLESLSVLFSGYLLQTQTAFGCSNRPVNSHVRTVSQITAGPRTTVFVKAALPNLANTGSVTAVERLVDSTTTTKALIRSKTSTKPAYLAQQRQPKTRLVAQNHTKQPLDTLKANPLFFNLINSNGHRNKADKRCSLSASTHQSHAMPGWRYDRSL